MDVVSYACSILETPALATTRRQKRIPQESARAGVKEDSLADSMVMTGLETTTSNQSTAQESTTTRVTVSTVATGHKLQICPCGWRKITSYRGLRIHQGKKRCLNEGGQRPRIDYLLQRESNQSSEAQQLDANHSLQCISTTVSEDFNSSKDNTMVEQTSQVEPTHSPQPVIERRPL